MKNSDIIGNLPDDVTEKILARLPIQDAVRTSVLSKNWRYKWTTLPVLAFNGLITHDSTNPALDGYKLVKVIYSVLCQHKGPIQEFSLSVTSMTTISYSDVDQWIKNFLSSKGIRKLRLSFTNEDRYKIHSSLFSSSNLRDLTLSYCIISLPPPTFGGFNHLTCLKLDTVSVNNEGFQNLIAKCPELKTLILIYVDGLNGLNIDYAPSLESLQFHGSPDYIWLKNTPHLVSASIGFTQLLDMNDNIRNGRSISLINNIVNFLYNLRRLVAGTYFLKLLAQGSVRKLFPPTFKNLCYVFFFELMFEDIDSLSLALGLIISSPNLTELTVKPRRTANSATDQMLKTAVKYLKGESRSIGCLMKLRYVQMKDMVGVGPEMEFIKLILGKSPSLEQMKIAPDKTVDGFIVREQKIVKDLICFARASKIAEIIYED
ncbi:hypothetical protein PTKIN_Ptkin02bG0032900 [Pterospermum kingtungense]